MFTIFPTIIAILLIVVIGHVIKRLGLLADSAWDSISRLCYWVLFPGLLFNLTSSAVVSTDFLGPFLLTISIAAAMIVLFSYVGGRVAGQTGPAISSLIQGGLRHNGFLALSILQGAGGLAALQIGGIAVAFLVPISNIVAVIVLFMCRKDSAKANMGAAITREVARNPLIGAVVLGGVVNWLNIPVPSFVTQSAGMLGAAALPLLLLCIGASLKFAAFQGHAKPLFVAAMSKILIFPALMIGLGLLFGVGNTALLVLAAVGAAPTASSSFALAKELGGDADLMAEIISVQTLVAAVSMPLWLITAQYLAS